MDRCWFGTGDTLFIRFFSFSNRLRALRAKRKLFSLPSKIYLDKDLSKAQITEFKHARRIVADARRVGKWVLIRNLRVVVHDSPRVGLVEDDLQNRMTVSATIRQEEIPFSSCQLLEW